MEIWQAWKNFHEDFGGMLDKTLPGGKVNDGLYYRITDFATKFLVCSKTKRFLLYVPVEYEGFPVVRMLLDPSEKLENIIENSQVKESNDWLNEFNWKLMDD
jgi:hypothetical protein